MADKGSVHSGHVKRRSKQLDRKMYEAEVDKLMERCRELEEDLVSFSSCALCYAWNKMDRCCPGDLKYEVTQ